jgi:arginase family enzyme
LGADVVEYNPTRDAPTGVAGVPGVTAFVAAKIAKELIGLMTLHAEAGEA